MKKAKKQTMGIITSGTTMAIGASIGSKLGGTAGGHLSQSMSGMSGQLPTMGTITSAGMLTRGLGDIAKTTKKKRR